MAKESTSFLSGKVTAGLLVAGGLAGAGYILWRYYQTQAAQDALAKPLGPISIPVAQTGKKSKDVRSV